MGPVEVVVVDSKKIACDGCSIASKHPLVYLNMGNDDNVICPYCSKNFVIRKEVITNKKNLY
jgi:uncharacterized Zn-finger protein